MRTRIDIREEPVGNLHGYADIPIAFPVERLLAVSDDGRGGVLLREQDAEVPYVKDYDAIPGNAPRDWPRSFDMSPWGHLAAWDDGRARRAGSALVAVRTPGLHLLEERDDLALLWDFRIDPQSRRLGIGTALFAAVEQWAVRHGCRELRVETQNTNLPACRFYAKQGCTLLTVDRDAYPSLAGEIQLIWSKSLSKATPA